MGTFDTVWGDKHAPFDVLEAQGRTEVVRKDLATAAKAHEATKVLTRQIRGDAEWQLRHLGVYEKRLGEPKDRMRGEAKEDENMKRLQNMAGVCVARPGQTKCGRAKYRR